MNDNANYIYRVYYTKIPTKYVCKPIGCLFIFNEYRVSKHQVHQLYWRLLTHYNPFILRDTEHFIKQIDHFNMFFLKLPVHVLTNKRPIGPQCSPDQFALLYKRLV